LTCWLHDVVDEGLISKLPLSKIPTSLGANPLLKKPLSKLLLKGLSCRTPVEFTALPVLEMPCTPWHALELLPPPVTLNVWLESPLSTDCSLDWKTPLSLKPLFQSPRVPRTLYSLYCR
jgi:hypothetical protein